MVGPLSYIGGKNSLAKKIISILPEHIAYVEAFAGGAQGSSNGGKALGSAAMFVRRILEQRSFTAAAMEV